MRTTIEVPDDLLTRAKAEAAIGGRSLKTLFIEALEEKLSKRAPKARLRPPVFGSPDAKPVDVLTPEQIDEAVFG